MLDWFAATLKQYPEIAIFLALGLGYYFGKFTFRGHRPGVGHRHPAGRRLDRTDSGLPSRSLSRRSSSSCFCLPSATASGRSSSAVSPRMACRKPSLRWSNACSACSSRSRSSRWQATTWATRRDFTRVRRRSPPRWASRRTPSTGLAWQPTRPRRLLDSMPIAYAVTYLFGTVGSAIVIALIGPALLRIDLPAACKDYEEKQGGGDEGTWRSRFRVAPVGSAGIPGEARRKGRWPPGG